MTELSLPSLPDELIEAVLVFCSIDDAHNSIASLAETSRQFFQLIYQSSDSHLWREIFLATFDEPRRVLGILRSVTHPDSVVPVFDWHGEFVRRMKARNFFRKTTGPVRPLAEDTESLEEALSSMVSLITTAAPFPLTAAVYDAVAPSKPPSFPPFILLTSAPKISLDLSQFHSRNTEWLRDALGRGYPRILTRRLLYGHLRSTKTTTGELRFRTTRKKEQGHALEEDERRFAHILEPAWGDSAAGQTFYKLVTMSSFIPNAVLTEADPPRYGLRNTPSRKERGKRVSVAEQYALARSIARKTAYNLRFLSERRCWGPYMPLSSEPGDAGDDEATVKVITNMANLYSQPLHHFLQQVLLAGPLDDDDDDDDYLPPVASTSTAATTGSSDHEAHSDNNGDVEVDAEAEAEGDADDTSSESEHDPFFLFGEEEEEPQETYVFPPEPHLLVPDYQYLAAARILIEANLKERLSQVVDYTAEATGQRGLTENEAVRLQSAIKSLDVLRMGGSPGFWNKKTDSPTPKGWRLDPEDFMDVDSEPSASTMPQPGPSQQPLGSVDWVEDPEGWDWAGVTGEWKRCVCWMDYRSLIYHNHTGLDDGHIHETLRIFPMTIHVVGYEKAPPVPSYSPSNHKGKGKDTGNDSSPSSQEEDLSGLLCYRLPIIHIEGESRGSDEDANMRRYVSGTVRMMGDGSVRWSMISSEAFGVQPEWVTESVQLGHIGSVMGVIGLWTGATHLKTDPVGPCWAWKVG